jgi:hypothetical protein
MAKNNALKNLVIYTCIFGDGYFLPKIKDFSSAKYYCFTDQNNLEPNGWQIINSTPIFKNDLCRSAREIKILAHKNLKEFERSIYIDPSVELISDPESLWSFLMGSDDSKIFGALFHSFRDSVLQEFEIIYREKLDSTQLLEEHLKAYLLTDPDGLQLKPIWSGMIARKHLDPLCIKAMEKWFYNVLRYSRRDQLSISSILLDIPEHSKNLKFENNTLTKFHRWPHVNYSRPLRYYSSVTDQIIPAIIRAEKETKEKIKILADRDAILADRDAILADRDAILADRDAILADRDAIIASRSWKITGWCRLTRKFIHRWLFK